jgi:hypothetical protein
MLKEESWQVFRKTGLLWWINRTLHLFGWAIVVDVSDSDEVLKVYPARTNWRGFNQVAEDEGFRQLTSYIEENAAELKRELTT